MPLTPQDIVRKEFREALRGYNQADVDLFLDEVVEEFTRLTEENQRLRVRLAAMQQEVARYREARGGSPVPMPAQASADPEAIELEVRARVRRYLEEQLRMADPSSPPSAPTTQTVDRISRDVPPPPLPRPPSGARTRADTDPPRPRAVEQERPRPTEPEITRPVEPETSQPEAPRTSREPFWAGE
jgi:DivIVA domain-containing protein